MTSRYLHLMEDIYDCGVKVSRNLSHSELFMRIRMYIRLCILSFSLCRREDRDYEDDPGVIILFSTPHDMDVRAIIYL